MTEKQYKDTIKQLTEERDEALIERFRALATPPADGGTVPAYTTSLDAALTLVPEGCEWEVYGGDKQAVAVIYVSGPKYVDGRAPTPALAMCIAALKARPNEGGPR